MFTAALPKSVHLNQSMSLKSVGMALRLFLPLCQKTPDVAMISEAKKTNEKQEAAAANSDSPFTSMGCTGGDWRETWITNAKLS